MCGIVGICINPSLARLDPHRISKLLTRSLHALEYRGYDSVGIAVLDFNNRLVIKKGKGTVEFVSNKLSFEDAVGYVGIGHTRWATHGAPSDENAHPHTDCSLSIAVVHNGIIRNYSSLKKKLEELGHRFSSDTDTEVIAHLIEENYKSSKTSFYNAFKKTITEIEGSYAVAVITSYEPGKIFFAKRESPLIVGYGDKENYLASDIPAIIDYTRKVTPLSDYDVGWISPDEVFIENLHRGAVKPHIINVAWKPEMAKKGGYPHFMIKEIHEQPLTLRATYEGLLSDNRIFVAAEKIIEADRVFVTAAGTSYHAGLVLKYYMESIARTPIYPFISSEYKYASILAKEGDVIIVISQSGETIDSLKALRAFKERGAKAIAITNVIGSAIDRESDYTILTRAGPEIGVAATKTFSAQVLTSIMLSVITSFKNGYLHKVEFEKQIKELGNAGRVLENSLRVSEGAARRLSETLYRSRNAYYLGRGLGVPLAMEAALKLKEISYIHAEAYPAGESKHGPIAVVEPGFPVLFIATSDAIEEIQSNIAEMNARGANTILLVMQGFELEVKPSVEIKLPQTSLILEPFTFIPAFQLIAYYTSVKLGYDPDKPRNLAKTVTVE